MKAFIALNLEPIECERESVLGSWQKHLPMSSIGLEVDELQGVCTMKFQQAVCVLGVDDIATKEVYTDSLYQPTVDFCRRWLTAGGGRKGIQEIGKEVILDVVREGQSACLLGLEIQDELRAFTVVQSGVDSIEDLEMVKSFRDACNNADWIPEHPALKLQPPCAYTMCLCKTTVSSEVVDHFIELCDSLAAAFLLQR